MNEKLDLIEEGLNTYYNAINLIALSPPGAQQTKVPEKPDILILVEQIESSGHLLMPGGLMQQPHIFIYEYQRCASIKRLMETINQNIQIKN